MGGPVRRNFAAWQDSAQRALRIISQVCQSLQKKHGQGIIHRISKPDNVFLVEMKGSGDFVKCSTFPSRKWTRPTRS